MNPLSASRTQEVLLKQRVGQQRGRRRVRFCSAPVHSRHLDA
jgi:hypothetical protein